MTTSLVGAKGELPDARACSGSLQSTLKCSETDWGVAGVIQGAVEGKKIHNVWFVARFRSVHAPPLRRNRGGVVPAAAGRRHTDGWGSRLAKAPDLIRVSRRECAHGLFNNTQGGL